MTYDTDRRPGEDQPKTRRTSLARTLARACVLTLARPIYKIAGAGQVRVFPENAPAEVKEFLDKQKVKGNK